MISLGLAEAASTINKLRGAVRQVASDPTPDTITDDEKAALMKDLRAALRFFDSLVFVNRDASVSFNAYAIKNVPGVRQRDKKRPEPNGELLNDQLASVKNQVWANPAPNPQLAALAAIEMEDLLGELSDREHEMALLSLDMRFTKEDSWGGRKHCRRLNDLGFKISPEGLRKMARRVQEVYRRTCG